MEQTSATPASSRADSADAQPPIVPLTADECWQLLEEESFGRLAVAVGDDLEIFPVNYAADDGFLYIRTAEGTKLAAVMISKRVAFEVDRFEPPGALSVVVKGDAEVLETQADISAAEQAGLRPWVASHKPRHIRIRPTEFTGRRLVFGPEPDGEPDITS